MAKETRFSIDIITEGGDWVGLDFLDIKNRDLMVEAIKENITTHHLLWVKEEDEGEIKFHHFRINKIVRFSYYNGIRTVEIKPIEWGIYGMGIYGKSNKHQA